MSIERKPAKRVGTHNGPFHADDLFATSALRRLFDVSIIRSRDQFDLARCNILVDVGGIYAPNMSGEGDGQGCFDHHQVKNKRDLARPNGVPYASAGLVWRDYGLQICGQYPEAFDAVDAFMQAIDAADTGTDLVTDPKPAYAGVFPVSVSAVLSGFNPDWSSDDSFERAFDRALLVADSILDNVITAAMSRPLAKIAVVSAKPDGVVLELERAMPWQEFVLEAHPTVLFVVFPTKEETWMVQAVPKTLGSFETKLPLPAEWAGKRDAELAAITGVEDAVFCHPGRFIGGAKTREGALRLADLAVIEVAYQASV